MFLAMVTPKNWSGKIFVSDSLLGSNPWTYTIKDSNREKVIGSLYEK